MCGRIRPKRVAFASFLILSEVLHTVDATDVHNGIEGMLQKTYSFQHDEEMAPLQVTPTVPSLPVPQDFDVEDTCRPAWQTHAKANPTWGAAILPDYWR